MSGSYEEALPPHTVAGLIEEVVRLAEALAVDHRVGAPPARIVTSVVGIRDFMFRLLGHFEEELEAPRQRGSTCRVGFQVPDRHGVEPK
jgi:hypothetical protein